MLASEFQIVDRFLEEKIALLIFARLVLLCQRTGVWAMEILSKREPHFFFGTTGWESLDERSTEDQVPLVPVIGTRSEQALLRIQL